MKCLVKFALKQSGHAPTSKLVNKKQICTGFSKVSTFSANKTKKKSNDHQDVVPAKQCQLMCRNLRGKLIFL